MKNFDSLKNLLKTSSVLENVSAAKAYMMKRFATQKRIAPNQMTEEDKAEALNNREYREIIQLIGNAHGYAGAFTKFHFEHGASIEDLKALMAALIEDPSIPRNLPMSIDHFANTPKGERINGVNPFEALNDSIRNIEVRRKAKWIVDDLPGDLRRSFREASPEDQQKLLNIGTMLNTQGEEVKKRLMAKARAFGNLAEFMTFAENYVKGYSNNDIASKMQKIEELEPEAGILYADDRYLMLSARTEKAQKDLCGIANWCINRGSFNNKSYGGGAIQINTFDFNRAATDPLHLLGTTISYEGQVTYSHDINDKNVKFTSDIAEHFRRFGYPESMIKVLLASLPVEAVIKKVITDLGLDNKSPITIVEDIIKSSYVINTEGNDAASKVIMSILMERLRPVISREDLFKLYSRMGAVGEFSAKLFNILFPDATEEERRVVMAKNEEIYNLITTIQTRRGAKISASMEYVLSVKDKVMEILNRGITEALAMAEPATKPAPTIAPPTTRPSTPSRPSPIPTKRPKVEPAPKAEAEDVIKRFEEEAKKHGLDIKTMLSK